MACNGEAAFDTIGAPRGISAPRGTRSHCPRSTSTPPGPGTGTGTGTTQGSRPHVHLGIRWGLGIKERGGGSVDLRGRFGVGEHGIGSPLGTCFAKPGERNGRASSGYRCSLELASVS